MPCGHVNFRLPFALQFSIVLSLFLSIYLSSFCSSRVPRVMMRARCASLSSVSVLEASLRGRAVCLIPVMLGCVPVIIADDIVLPFEEILDYRSFSVKVTLLSFFFVPHCPERRRCLHERDESDTDCERASDEKFRGPLL